jgi:hypothetical protein
MIDRFADAGNRVALGPESLGRTENEHVYKAIRHKKSEEQSSIAVEAPMQGFVAKKLVFIDCNE